MYKNILCVSMGGGTSTAVKYVLCVLVGGGGQQQLMCVVWSMRP